MDTATDYLSDTLNSPDRDTGDIASIITLALIESAGNLEQAHEFLDRARLALAGTELGVEADKLIGSALHHIEVFMEID